MCSVTEIFQVGQYQSSLLNYSNFHLYKMKTLKYTQPIKFEVTYPR